MTRSYDALGRVIAVDATTVNAPFDTRVRRQETVYDTRGLVETVRQRDTAGGGGTVLDQTDYAYDAWGLLSGMRQDPDSAMSSGASTAGRAEFVSTWTNEKNTATDGWQNLRTTEYDAPGQDPVYYASASVSIDEQLGRPSAITDGGGMLAYYTFMGSGTAISAHLVEPDMALRLYTPGASAGATYPTYLDRLDRVVKQRWRAKASSSPASVPYVVDGEVAQYNRAGQAEQVLDYVAASGTATRKRLFDQANTYDALHRLIQRNEGELSGGSIANADFARFEVFLRDTAGNALTAKVNLDTQYPSSLSLAFTDDRVPTGAGSVSIDERADTRTFNKRNELASRSYYDEAHVGSPATPTISYDQNGNLLYDGEYTYTYNPWNQLVQIEYGGGGGIGSVARPNLLGPCHDSGFAESCVGVRAEGWP